MIDGDNGRRPKPEDIGTLHKSIDALAERGAVRKDAKDLIKVLENNRTWGLPKGDVSTSIDVLRTFVHRPYLFREDVEELISAFQEEKKFSVIEWDKIRQDIGKRTKSVRDTTIKLACVALAVTIIYFGAPAANDAIYQEYYSPAAVARQQEYIERNRAIEAKNLEAKKAQEEKEKQVRINAEEQMTLGLKPSAISSYGFRIRYNPPDKNIRYIEVGGEKSFFSIYAGRSISWEQKNDRGVTESISPGVVVDGYTRVKDGKRLPMLKVSIVGTSTTYENWFLRDKEEGIDTSVVVFEDVKTQKENFFSIEWPQGTSYFQFKLMKKEVVPSK